jgi:hypothetical protein
MMPKKEDTIETTITGLQYLSMWDEEEETSSPRMDQTISSFNSSSSSSHSSVASSLKSPRRQSPPGSPSRTFSGSSDHKRSQNKNNNRVVGGEYELKNARDALVGSISAVINFLLTSGVPKPATDQLQKNLEMGRYFAVMKRVQDYIQCLPATEVDEIMAKIHLSVTAWEALRRLKTIEHKRAYKLCFNLRYENGKSSPAHQEIKSAIELQVKLAEQCTACQKKLYLVQKWQRHLLKKMKRSTMIEPEGYKPSRCL